MADPGNSLWRGYLYRFLSVLLLVFATYNPEGYSYFHWLMRDPGSVSPELVLAGVVLLIGWAIVVRSALRSLGLLGLSLAIALFGTLIWLVIDWGLVPAQHVDGLTYLIQIAICGVLSTGVYWSHIRRRISGQVDVDDI